MRDFARRSRLERRTPIGGAWPPQPEAWRNLIRGSSREDIKAIRRRVTWLIFVAFVTILAATPLLGQSVPESAPHPAQGLNESLRQAALDLHCCATDEFLDAAVLHKRVAEISLTEDPGAVDELRLAAYLFFYAGELDRARVAMTRVGNIARERGVTSAAADAFLEAAHMALAGGDMEVARDLSLTSREMQKAESER